MWLPRRLLGLDPLLVDAALALTLATLTLVFAVQYPPVGRWPRFGVAAVVLSLLCSLPLTLRRGFPWPVLMVTGGAFALYTAGGYQPGLNLWGPLLACYTVASRQARRSATGAALFTGALWFANGVEAGVGPLLALGQAVVAPGIARQFGCNVRSIRERNEQLALLTEELAREQAARARHAVTEERLRIARELHDVLAHHMSVISVQAGLARYVFHSDPGTASAALETIAAASGETLKEMRGLLGLLRVDADQPGPEVGTSEEYQPAPGLDRLPELAERLRAAGSPVEVLVTGEPVSLAPGVELCAFRVFQEALTNILKHAAHSRVVIELDYRGDHFIGRVTNDGSGRAVGGVTDSGGHGLVGMRERVNLYGGDLHTGTRATGGFGVCFTLPASRSARDAGASSAAGGRDQVRGEGGR